MSLPELPKPDLLVQCGQSILLEGWTKEKVRAYALEVLRYATDKVAPSDQMEPRGYLPAMLEKERIREGLLKIAERIGRQAT
jgi:hypothetical protein